LLAVDDPLVAISNGAGLQAGQVRDGAWLGEGLAPNLLASGPRGNEPLLLFFGAVLQDHRPAHHLAEATWRPDRAGARQLLGHALGSVVVEAAAALACGPGREREPSLCQRSPPRPQRGVVAPMVGYESADLVAKCR